MAGANIKLKGKYFAVPDISGISLNLILANCKPKSHWEKLEARILGAYKVQSPFTSSIESDSDEDCSPKRRICRRASRTSNIESNTRDSDSAGKEKNPNTSQVNIAIPSQDLYEDTSDTQTRPSTFIPEPLVFNDEELNAIVQDLDASTQTVNSADLKFQDIVLKHLADMKELQELNSKLLDKDFSKKIERFVASIGGKDLKGIIAGTCDRLISDSLATRISYTGKSKKGAEKIKFLHFSQVHQLIVTRRVKSIQFSRVGSGTLPTGSAEDATKKNNQQVVLTHVMGGTSKSTNENNEFNEHNDLREDLRKWCLTYNVTKDATNHLLKILSSQFPEENLPKDSRILLKTTTLRYFINI
ncbi:unnamed protein product [Allacma fusca]|uniref:DUF4806 domain-containing protein n=1 Tax=Allacma fusca TaxID=39272 RepID=A0A8J2L1J2_9HEXA|nr:unnamed protein product [Allacma fusca]